jgi:VanZ family protein
MRPPTRPHRALASALSRARAATPWWRLVLALLLGTVTWLALAPAPPRALSTGWDKLNHVLAFSTLAIVATLGLMGAWWRIAAALLAYGGLIELLQGLLPPREADLADLLSDGLGIAIGLLLAQGLRRAARRGQPIRARPGDR